MELANGKIATVSSFNLDTGISLGLFAGRFGKLSVMGGETGASLLRTPSRAGTFV
ncbi:MAG: hypothetical protein ACHQIK_17665 [Candidatus Acidiferrales bacterium]